MSEQKKYLSPSQLDTYTRCGHQWYLRYIEGRKVPPGIAALKGRATHKGAEGNWKQKIESRQDLPAKQIKEIASDAFEQEKKGGFILTPEEESAGLQKTLGHAKDRTVALAGLFAEKVAPIYQPKMVEQNFTIEIPKAPFDISGRVDMVDDQNRVPDLKTSGKRKSQSEADNSVQLTVYAAGVQMMTGLPVPEVRLDVLVDTKEPQHQQIISTRGKRDFEALVNRINMVTRGIEAGVFTPAVPGSWWCSPRFCGYFLSGCPYINADRIAAAEKLAKEE